MPSKKQLTLTEINKKINEEACINFIEHLQDKNLIDEYKKCESTKNKIRKLTLILEKHQIDK